MPRKTVQVASAQRISGRVHVVLLHNGAEWRGWRFRLSFDEAAGRLAGFELLAAATAATTHPKSSGQLSERVNAALARVAAAAPKELHTGAPGAITARLLRKVPLGLLENEARRYLAEHGVDEEPLLTAGWLAASAGAALLVGRPMDSLPAGPQPQALASSLRDRPGRRGRSDEEYAALAAYYVEALGSPRPVELTAERVNLATTTVRNALHEARRRGLLSAPPTRGRPGGQLTPKALDVLRTMNKET